MLYELEPGIFSPEAVIHMEKFNQKYHDYFVNNSGDGKFLSYVTIQFTAQEGYNKNNIINEDYLKCITPIPIFSGKFIYCLKNDLTNEMEFIKCNVKCEGKTFEYYIGKILKYNNFVDKEKSEYRCLSDGSKIINRIKYMDRINNNDFLIARDYDYHFIYLVSDKFKELVEKNNFNIKLKNA